MKKSWQISRRRMLKGLGASIALPFLDAMVPNSLISSPLQKPPLRAAFMFMPNGVHPDKWTPMQYGRNFELSPILSPLQTVKDDILVLNELRNRLSSYRGDDGHYTKTASFLTCLPIFKTTGDNLHSGGTSVDQMIAKHIGHQTLFPSLQYGMERISSGIDANVGFTRLYGSSISWQTPTQPCSKEINPRLAFDRLFRNFVPSSKKEEDPWKQSVLDLVMDDAKGLQRKLGRSDQDKLEEYLESIRSVEKRILSYEQQKAFEAKITNDIREEIVRLNVRIDEYSEMNLGVDITEKVRQMMDIMTLAFWSDATRVSSFMFGNSVSNRNFTFLPGVFGSHHQISHHKDDPRHLDEYETINRWHVEQYAYFLNKLKSIPEGDGNMLDNSMVLLGSGIRDGNRHSPYNLPVLLAGKGGGAIKTGQNLKFKEETPLANLYQSMLNIYEVPQECFGDSTGELCEIYA
ncbi:hypothetical protein OKW21_002751 [Catalinimonas alkaloidigena]|uniref:DUF1552 domain-containing protein n=1 Tax=Catalinimonas alkaloidigena TaxID=1075417 RepID=UPI0024066511|nr:DUF1552 domain-containing protein [Catalinimonas alkaloidigena]MDF9797488.1 hypothetical protein [Catalinimonas alkaloidigena]